MKPTLIVRCNLLAVVLVVLGAVPGLTLELVVKDLINGTETTYSEQDLRDLNTVQFFTTTPWTDGVQDFVGTPMADVIAGVNGGYHLRLTAINDYVVTMPLSVIAPDYPLIVYERNGAPMSVRDKGPYWVLFPFDSDPSFLTESMLSRSIWQLVKIEITH